MNTRLLKGIRVTQGYNQQDMATKLKMNVGNYCRKENGKVKFAPEEIKKITSLLGLSLEQVDEIFFDKGLTNGKKNEQSATSEELPDSKTAA